MVKSETASIDYNMLDERHLSADILNGVNMLMREGASRVIFS